MSGSKHANPKITIKNVVASFILDRELDLEEVHSKFKEESLFDEQIFNYGVVVLRVKKPKMSFLIYRTGKIICTGAESIQAAKGSDKYLIRRFRRAGLKAGLKSRAEIQNIVSVMDLGVPLNLELVAHQMPEIEYEVEQFPGAIYRHPLGGDSKATALLFGSGKVVCVGCRRKEELSQIFRKISSRLKKLRL
jgi:transcription initiation factor TFIID TATA-box-binding protein